MHAQTVMMISSLRLNLNKTNIYAFDISMDLHKKVLFLDPLIHKYVWIGNFFQPTRAPSVFPKNRVLQMVPKEWHTHTRKKTSWKMRVYLFIYLIYIYLIGKNDINEWMEINQRRMSRIGKSYTTFWFRTNEPILCVERRDGTWFLFIWNWNVSRGVCM